MNKIYFKSVIALLLLLGGFSAAFAQDSLKKLTLSQAIRLALEKNRQVRAARLDEKASMADYKKTDAIFLPQVSASYTAMTTNDPLSAFGFKLEQRSIAAADFNPSLLNHPTGTPDFNAKVEVMQPLINMDMLYARKAAYNQSEVFRYQAERTEQYVVFAVKQAYLQVQLAGDALKVFEEALATAKSIQTFTENHYQQGLLQKSDLLNARVQTSMAESRVTDAKSSVKDASDQLSLLTGQPAGTTFDLEQEADTVAGALDTAINVPANRPDLLAMQKAVESSEMMERSAKMNYLPKLNAFGNYQLNDRNFASGSANSYMAGIQLSWNIFSGNRTKHTVDAQRFRSEKLSEQLAGQKEAAQAELEKARRDLNDAGVELNSRIESVKQAAEALRILKNRYEQGLVNITDLQLAENQLSQQQLAQSQAKFKLNVTQAYLTFLTTSNL